MVYCTMSDEDHDSTSENNAAEYRRNLDSALGEFLRRALVPYERTKLNGIIESLNNLRDDRVEWHETTLPLARFVAGIEEYWRIYRYLTRGLDKNKKRELRAEAASRLVAEASRLPAAIRSVVTRKWSWKLMMRLEDVPDEGHLMNHGEREKTNRFDTARHKSMEPIWRALNPNAARPGQADSKVLRLANRILMQRPLRPTKGNANPTSKEKIKTKAELEGQYSLGLPISPADSLIVAMTALQIPEKTQGTLIGVYLGTLRLPDGQPLDISPAAKAAFRRAAAIDVNVDDPPLSEQKFEYTTLWGASLYIKKRIPLGHAIGL